MNLEEIQSLVAGGQYSVRPHVVRHMVEEAFFETDLLQAISDGDIIEKYPERHSCLILGYYAFGSAKGRALHVLVDYTERECLDIVTAYEPRSPWWRSPTERGDFDGSR